jgi:hypothetical protein
MKDLILRLPTSLLILACLTLGLAPFFPQPHLLEKLTMIFSGQLTRPMDIVDLILHGAPWILLGAKLFITMRP